MEKLLELALCIPVVFWSDAVTVCGHEGLRGIDKNLIISLKRIALLEGALIDLGRRVSRVRSLLCGIDHTEVDGDFRGLPKRLEPGCHAAGVIIRDRVDFAQPHLQGLAAVGARDADIIEDPLVVLDIRGTEAYVACVYPCALSVGAFRSHYSRIARALVVIGQDVGLANPAALAQRHAELSLPIVVPPVTAVVAEAAFAPIAMVDIDRHSRGIVAIEEFAALGDCPDVLDPQTAGVFGIEGFRYEQLALVANVFVVVTERHQLNIAIGDANADRPSVICSDLWIDGRHD